MSKSYEDYEQEYQSYLGRIRSFLASARTQSTLLECQRLLGDARKCATAMQAMAEVEGNSFRTQEAQNLVKRDLGPLEQELNKSLAKHTETANREDLFYEPPSGNGSLSTQALISNSNDMLLETQALVAESEQIGMGTLTQMNTQREQMQIASDNINETVNMTAQARHILKKMRTKLLRNKLFLYCLIVLLVFLNGLVLRAMWKKHHK